MKWVFMDKDRCELRWMWLPMFLAQNTELLKKLEEELNRRFKGLQATERVLTEMNLFITGWLQQQLPTIRGFEKFLEGLKHIEEG